MAFGLWLTMLLQARGEDILRVKGFLNVGATAPCSSASARRASTAALDEWPTMTGARDLVFIGRGVSGELEASLAFDRAAR